MPETLIYSDYDPFARVYNEHWGIKFSQEAMPILEELLLKKIPKGCQILDLCCGTGQLVQELLAKGYQVTGIDYSEGMLDFARKNAPNGKFIEGDARLFKMPSIFDGIISTSSALNHMMSIEELIQVFQNVYSALQENGWFVFDMNMEERYESWGTTLVGGDVKDDYAWASRIAYDPQEKISKYQNTIFYLTNGNWQRSDSSWVVKAYSQTKVKSALRSVGFTEVRTYDGERDLELENQRGWVYFVARKPLSN